MALRWLVVTVAALVLAVTGSFATRISSQERSLGHEDILCRDCHSGVRAEAHVPEEACLACHPAESLAEPEAGAGFEHGSHGAADPVEMDCVACHTHEVGSTTLGTGRESCVLCHADDLDGTDSGACRSCHPALPASVVTSQGVPLRHGVLEWMDEACVRCHYVVSAPPGIRDDCGPCHGEPPVPDAGPDADLHPSHLQVACTSCHEGGEHRIAAMSAAVSVACDDCHDAPHQAEPGFAADGPGVCGACHAQVHQAQQRLFLGSSAGDLGSEASMKFQAGLSCRSCHVEAAASDAHGMRAASCGTCHEPRYGRVTDWWTVGGRERAETVAAYLEGARQALAEAGRPGDTTELERARAWVALVVEGGAQHNPSLSHRLLRESLDRAVDAWRASGAIIPLPPVLGVEPRPGECSFCHYDMPFQELAVFRGTPHDFHRDGSE